MKVVNLFLSSPVFVWFLEDANFGLKHLAIFGLVLKYKYLRKNILLFVDGMLRVGERNI
jgi:hypothetical protein